ncbi:hypothetical protein [Actinotalea sp. Marseille-Q4924]|uniref:hypothetical protein n=1 Tax=Actinotalea sp. Marseille-Q4924 TaxID=2866571 RepID=UPI001CE49940|nr:hypothetical protein [Actinotalea sp. Marseille-Q4924]
MTRSALPRTARTRRLMAGAALVVALPLTMAAGCEGEAEIEEPGLEQEGEMEEGGDD